MFLASVPRVLATLPAIPTVFITNLCLAKISTASKMARFGLTEFRLSFQSEAQELL